MSGYHHQKIKTILEIIRDIENWPEAIGLRLNRKTKGTSLLRFRDGLNVVCRRATRDWDVVHECVFAGGYARAFRWLKEFSGAGIVLDLGGNIGLFSLLAARSNPKMQIKAFEPGPPNARLFEANRLLNEAGERITLFQEAVGGETGTAEWFFDAWNPGASSLFGTDGEKIKVSIVSLSDAMARFPGPIALLKIDIEGAEYDILKHTPAEVWQRIPAVALELHDDPRKELAQKGFFEKMTDFGYIIEEESVVSFFLHRPVVK